MRRRAVFFVVFWAFFCGVARADSLEDAPKVSDLESSRTRLLAHRPIYFVSGKPDTKVQLSFKVQFFTAFELYFGYTQLMMWDLFKLSAPFRDINYGPEVFYRWFLNAEKNQVLDFGPYEHESNGRSGTPSRSWNRTYLRYHSTTGVSDELRALWSIKVWYPYGFRGENADILDYLGVFELQVAIQNFLGPFFGENTLSLRLFPGGKSHVNPLKGGQELTLTAKTSVKALAPSVVFQLFHGYGENLLDYKTDRFALRGGFGF